MAYTLDVHIDAQERVRGGACTAGVIPYCLHFSADKGIQRSVLTAHHAALGHQGDVPGLLAGGSQAEMDASVLV